MSLIKITTPVDGFIHQANAILAKKCRVYIAKGDFDPADIPDTKAELLALYEGAGLKFIPLGDNDDTGSRIGFKQKTKKLDFSTVGLGYEITGKLVNVTVTKAMKTFIQALGLIPHSLLFVPDGDTETFYAASGVTITKDGDFGIVDEAISTITLNLFRDADDFNTVILLDKLVS